MHTNRLPGAALWFLLGCSQPTGICLNNDSCPQGHVCDVRAHQCVASFDLGPSDLPPGDLDDGTSVTLTVTRAGEGSGEVVSNPPGIRCGVQCTARFSRGSTVQLAATDFAGSALSGWSEARCATDRSCQVGLSQSRSIVVQFRLTEWASVPGLTGSFNGVWVGGATDAWAVGSDGGGKMIHYDGAKWASCSGPPIGESLLGVWGSGPNDVWAVGGSIGTPGSLTVVRYRDGTCQPWSVPGQASATGLLGIWGSGPADIWAVGNRAWRYDGTQWAVDPTYLFAVSPYGIWGSSAMNIWAAGLDAFVYHRGGPDVQWSRKSYQDLGVGNLRAIGGGADNDIWAVGVGGSMLHFDGTAWSKASLKDVMGNFDELRGVWASGPDNVWVVGNELLLHYNGTIWSVRRTPTWKFNAVSGSGTQTVWAVGTNGLIARPAVTGATKEVLEEKVKPTVERFLADRGLELSPEKTVITHIDAGFDFLGHRPNRP